MEVFCSTNINKFHYLKWLNYYILQKEIKSEKLKLNDKKLLNILFLDLINCFRGYRHTKGFPTRGQRTRTNAKTIKTQENSVKLFKINFMRKIHTNNNLVNLNTFYLAEQVNLLWKSQWKIEWREARKKRLKITNKLQSPVTIDIFSMSKNIVKKKKSLIKKIYFH